MNDCCHPKEKSGFKLDPVMHGSLMIIIISIVLYFANLVNWQPFSVFAEAQMEMLKDMSWGVALGLISVGLMNKIPREYFTAIMGRGDKFGDIVKASIAGVVLDMCNHGILVITGKLYERGLSTPQVLTFLISSPWNSLSLTFILIAMIGLKWTLVFTLASMVIAIISGMVYLSMTKAGFLPANPNACDLPDDLNVWQDFKSRVKGWKPSFAWAKEIAHDGWKDGQMIVRWILFGALMAAALRAFVPPEIFSEYLGPSLVGLLVTLALATIVEICSEGSAPIAAEIMNTGGAAGNGFTFLMAGVATDYTEILVVRQFTGSWKIALCIPLVTVPQILILGYLFNVFG